MTHGAEQSHSGAMHPWTRICAALLIAAAALSVTPAAGTPAPAGTDPLPDRSWPLLGRPVVVTGFLPPPRDWQSGHRGVDLATAPGAAVLAPITGIVSFAGQVVDRPVMSIRTGELRVSLEPVTAEVPVGSLVVAGQPIGHVADGLSHCAPARCLHWGLRVAGEYRNPLLLVLRGRPVLVRADSGSAATGLR